MLSRSKHGSCAFAHDDSKKRDAECSESGQQFSSVVVRCSLWDDPGERQMHHLWKISRAEMRVQRHP
jgi:hypothetical protein